MEHISKAAPKNLLANTDRRLTRAEFQGLADMPAEVEWFQNLDSLNTSASYQVDLRNFMKFLGIKRAEEFRDVTRAHVIAWRDDLAGKELAPATIRRKLSAVSSLFEYLCDKNLVTHNPVAGVKRPKKESGAGKTPVLSDEDTRLVLDAPDADSVIGRRDRAILSLGAYDGLRVSEVCQLTIKDLVRVQGMTHLRLKRKGQKEQMLVLAPIAEARINDYLSFTGHDADPSRPLFLALKSNSQENRDRYRHLNRDTLNLLVKKYAKAQGVYTHGLCFHSLRATAATKANQVGGDMKAVQDMMGHASISTTEGYCRNDYSGEKSAVLKVNY